MALQYGLVTVMNELGMLTQIFTFSLIYYTYKCIKLTKIKNWETPSLSFMFHLLVQLHK